MLSNYEAGGLSDQIAEILDDLEEPAAGIARLLSTTDDLQSLTPKQRAIFDRDIIPALQVSAERYAKERRAYQMESIKD